MFKTHIECLPKCVSRRRILKVCFGIRSTTGVATVPCMLVRLIGHFQSGRLKSLRELPAVD